MPIIVTKLSLLQSKENIISSLILNKTPSTPWGICCGISTCSTQALGGWNSSGFMLILQSFEMQPLNCSSDCTPSKTRMCVNPISLMNSNLECSESVGMVLVTRNMVLMISCEEYPSVLYNQIRDVIFSTYQRQRGMSYQSSFKISNAASTFPSQQALIIA